MVAAVVGADVALAGGAAGVWMEPQPAATIALQGAQRLVRNEGRNAPTGSAQPLIDEQLARRPFRIPWSTNRH